jgi:hypothetical protein
MARHLLISASLLLTALAGCQIDSDQSRRSKGTFAYSGWKSFSEEPINLAPDELFMVCAPIGETPEELAKRIERERKRFFGPHAPSVRYFANESAWVHLREDGTGPLPSGATIVKEKWLSNSDGLRALIAYAAMIKREPGYDPDRGDWEYVYVELTDDGERVQRGKLQTCIDCHARARPTDYLFRTHLKDAK